MIIFHRISRFIWRIHLYTLARFISNICRFIFGVEIHPQAQIGKSLKIVSGKGIVIGSSAIVGNNCVIYGNVTLGNNGKDLGEKRHPTLKDNVLIHADAKILGNIVIGNHVIIGNGSVVLKDIPDDRYVPKTGVIIKYHDDICIKNTTNY